MIRLVRPAPSFSLPSRFSSSFCSRGPPRRGAGTSGRDTKRATPDLHDHRTADGRERLQVFARRRVEEKGPVITLLLRPAYSEGCSVRRTIFR